MAAAACKLGRPASRFICAHLFANQLQRAMRGECCTLLPADDMAAVIAGEEDGTIRFNELFVRAIVVSGALVLWVGNGAGHPGAEVVGNSPPVHVHGLSERF